jgi:glycerophosphoryl diester phosphodiesterase
MSLTEAREYIASVQNLPDSTADPNLVTIPTLEQVLEELGDGGVEVNIEVKTPWSNEQIRDRWLPL